MRQISFQHIAVYLPDGGADDPALVEARSLARNVGARLTILSALPIHWRSHTAERLRRHEHARLAAVVRALGHRADAAVLDGPPTDALHRAVVDRGIDLLVKTARPTSLLDRVVGGVARSLVRHSPCPVWVVRSPERSSRTPVIAMVGRVGWAADDDDQALSSRVLALASDLAAFENRPLLVAHAFDPIAERVVARAGAGERSRYLAEETRHLEADIGTLLAEAGVDAEIALMRGDPASAVANLAVERGAETIVVGNRGRTGIAGLIVGNTAERVIDEVTSSVLAVRAT